MATDRKAEVTWQGDLMSGNGSIDSVTSGAFGGLDVSWPARSEAPEGKTSPEELIAAAHSSCFSMAFSNGLASNQTPATRLNVTADVEFTPGTGITGIKLTVRGVVDGMSNEDFVKAAEAAKTGCPVSQALSGTTITLDAALA